MALQSLKNEGARKGRFCRFAVCQLNRPHVARDARCSLQPSFPQSRHRIACTSASGLHAALRGAVLVSTSRGSQHKPGGSVRGSGRWGSCDSCRFWVSLSANTPCFPRFKGQSPTNPERTKKTHDSCECLSIHRNPYQPTQSASLPLPRWKGYRDGLYRGLSL